MINSIILNLHSALWLEGKIHTHTHTRAGTRTGLPAGGAVVGGCEVLEVGPSQRKWVIRAWARELQLCPPSKSSRLPEVTGV